MPKLGPDGQLEVTQVFNGVTAEVLRVIYRTVTHDQVNQSLTNNMARRYPGAQLVGEPKVVDDTQNNVMTMESHYQIPKLLEERNGNWLLRFRASNFAGLFQLPSTLKRTAPVFIPGFPEEVAYSFEAHFPDDVSAVRDPQTQSVRNKYFAFTVSSSFRGSLAKTTLNLKTLANRIEARDVPSFDEDLRKVNNIPENGLILIAKQDVRASGLFVASKSFKQTIHDRLQDNIKRISVAIDAGKLSGGDLINAYCERSNAYGDLDQLADAQRDAAAAIKLDPNSGMALRCRGGAYYSAGDFQRSVTDFSRAVSLGETSAETYYSRGLARFYLGRLQEAADDFTKASELDENEEGHYYMQLWQAWTYRRLGQPLPDSMVKQAAAQAHGDWPRPALALLTGSMQPQQVLQIIDSKKGDELYMTQTEGYFYLAQYYLLQNDIAQATNYLQKVRDLGVAIYTEYVAAAFELKRLNANVPSTAAAATTSSN